MSRNLFGLTLSAQQALALSLARDLLGRRHVRIDVEADGPRGKAIALDKAGRSATDTLRALAHEAIAEADRRDGAMLSAMLRIAIPPAGQP